MATHFTDFSLYSLNYQPNLQNVCELNQNFDIDAFSKFKYGDTLIAEKYAKELAHRLKPQLNKKVTYFLAGSASQSVPTAARSIATALAKALQKYGLTVKLFDIAGQSFSQDYSSLNNEERAKMLATIQPKVYNPIITPLLRTNPVIVVDDIRITGLHQKKIEELAISESWQSVLFCYVATLDTLHPKDPELEWILNHHYVNNLERLLEIVNSNHFAFNARVCKFILSAPLYDLKKFVALLPSKTIEQMLALMQTDGYNNMPPYQEGFTFIESQLQQRLQVLTRK